MGSGGCLADPAFRDLDIAEEAAAEAFATAVKRWPADGVPPNPGAWLTTTAVRKAIDRIRRENKRDDKHREAQMPSEPELSTELGVSRVTVNRAITVLRSTGDVKVKRGVGTFVRRVPKINRDAVARYAGWRRGTVLPEGIQTTRGRQTVERV